jgi:hypothetical protein
LSFVPTAIECFYRKQSFHFADGAAATPGTHATSSAAATAGGGGAGGGGGTGGAPATAAASASAAASSSSVNHSGALDLPLQHIAIGDTQGNIHLITLSSEFGLTTEVGMKKKNQILFADAIKVSCCAGICGACFFFLFDLFH